MRRFGNDLPLVELPASSGARVLQIDVPVTDLFDAEGSAVSPEGAETLSLVAGVLADPRFRSEEHTSELQSLMRISYAVFCLKKQTNSIYTRQRTDNLHSHRTHLISN